MGVPSRSRLAILLVCSMLLIGCGKEESGQSEGYQMLEPTEENLEWLRDWTQRAWTGTEGDYALSRPVAGGVSVSGGPGIQREAKQPGGSDGRHV